MQLPRVPATRVPSAVASRAQRPGCHGAWSASARRELHPDSAVRRPGAPPRSRPCGRPGDRPPPRRRARAAPRAPRATRRGCGGTAASIAASSSSVGRTPDRAAGAAGAPADRPRDQPSSKIATSRSPRPTLRRDGVEQRDQQVGAQVRLLVGERVDQPHGAPTGVVRGQVQRVELVGPHERVAEHLDEPASASARATERRARWPAVRPAPAGATGRVDGIASYPRSRATSSTRSTAGDEVGPPRRRRHGDRVGAGVGDRRSRSTAASRAPRRPRTAGRRAASAGRARSSNDGTGTPAVDVRERSRATPPPCSTSSATARATATGGSARVDAALEPLRRLAGQLVPPGRPGDRDRVEVRGLDRAGRSSPRSTSLSPPPITAARPIGRARAPRRGCR